MIWFIEKLAQIALSLVFLIVVAWLAKVLIHIVESIF